MKNLIKTRKISINEASVIYGVLLFFCLIVLLPFVTLVCSSLSSSSTILSQGARPWIQNFNTDAYYVLFQRINDLLNSYLTTIIVTVAGTAVNILLVSSSAFAISRKNFKGGNILTFFYAFTIMFQAGYVPNYIWFRNYLHITDTYFVMILAPAFMVAHMVFLRAFYSGLPESMYEAAKMDGANEFCLYFRIATPLIIPGVATACLYSILSYWNDSFTALIYARNYTPLAVYLKDISAYVEWMKIASENGWGSLIGGREMPTQTILYAIAVATTFPMLVVFMFLQKFFVGGLTVGAEKG